MRRSLTDEFTDSEAKLEMTPMIDVTFLLLIFFILTLKFKVLEGKLAAYLPKDVGVKNDNAEHKEKIEITIEVIEAGDKVYAAGTNEGQPWGGEPGRRWTIKPGTRTVQYQILSRKYDTVEEVRARMTELFDRDPERPSTVDARAGTYYADVVPILDAIIEAGYRDITFVGEYR